MRSVEGAIAMGLLLLVTSCSSSTNPDGTPEPQYPDIAGLVAFYNFDGSLKNAVSDQHHASAPGTVNYVADRDGTPNSAVQAVGDTILVPDHPDLDITTALTLAAWVKPELSGHAFGAVVDKYYLTAYSFGTSLVSQPDTLRMLSVIANENFFTGNVVPIGTGEWFHIAFTLDQASGEGKFYLNGAFVSSMTRQISIGTTDAGLMIGRSHYGDVYLGAIDQLAVFGRALTPAEIAELFGFE